MIISDLITVKVANENYIVPGNMVKLAQTHLSKNILSHMAQRYAHWPATQASKPISSWSRSMAMVEAMVEEGGDILTARLRSRWQTDVLCLGLGCVCYRSCY